MTHLGSSAPLVVGYECLKSFLGTAHARAATQFFRAKWRQRRTYFYKQWHGQQQRGVLLTGTNRRGMWWVAVAPRVCEEWAFFDQTFLSRDDVEKFCLEYVAEQ
jgi:hypothetical protein